MSKTSDANMQPPLSIYAVRIHVIYDKQFEAHSTTENLVIKIRFRISINELQSRDR